MRNFISEDDIDQAILQKLEREPMINKSVLLINNTYGNIELKGGRL